MRYSKLIRFCSTVFCASLLSQTSNACFVCDEVVEFDQIRAQCFLADYQQFEKAINESDNFRAEIDLSECANDVAAGIRGIDALPEFPSASTAEEPLDLNRNLRSVYVLDANGARCLQRLLDNLQEPIDPTVTFDLTSDC